MSKVNLVEVLLAKGVKVEDIISIQEEITKGESFEYPMGNESLEVLNVGDFSYLVLDKKCYSVPLEGNILEVDEIETMKDLNNIYKVIRENNGNYNVFNFIEKVKEESIKLKDFYFFPLINGENVMILVISDLCIHNKPIFNKIDVSSKFKNILNKEVKKSEVVEEIKIESTPRSALDNMIQSQDIKTQELENKIKNREEFIKNKYESVDYLISDMDESIVEFFSNLDIDDREPNMEGIIKNKYYDLIALLEVGKYGDYDVRTSLEAFKEMYDKCDYEKFNSEFKSHGKMLNGQYVSVSKPKFIMTEEELAKLNINNEEKPSEVKINLPDYLKELEESNFLNNYLDKKEEIKENPVEDAIIVDKKEPESKIVLGTVDEKILGLGTLKDVSKIDLNKNINIKPIEGLVGINSVKVEENKEDKMGFNVNLLNEEYSATTPKGGLVESLTANKSPVELYNLDYSGANSDDIEFIKRNIQELIDLNESLKDDKEKYVGNPVILKDTLQKHVQNMIERFNVLRSNNIAKLGKNEKGEYIFTLPSDPSLIMHYQALFKKVDENVGRSLEEFIKNNGNFMTKDYGYLTELEFRSKYINDEINSIKNNNVGSKGLTTKYGTPIPDDFEKCITILDKLNVAQNLLMKFLNAATIQDTEFINKYQKYNLQKIIEDFKKEVEETDPNSFLNNIK